MFLQTVSKCVQVILYNRRIIQPNRLLPRIATE